MKGKSPISDAEAEVLRVLWGAGGPVTTAEICRDISDKTGWDRSTVRTLIRRLVEKGAIEEQRLGVLSYRPLLAEEDYRRSLTKSFLERHYGGSAKRLIASLVQSDNLTAGDIAELREFLNTGGDGRERGL
ncbi:BlaI family transcriptional regulator, penicillinase repressor [Sporobacter termitidis DSM 10068]|uniref:BlaI family transcriptional regulator, penicillinase repressor n=1 Tax=Sporobacter termitidis DSM 10068 TaxID=1123282 RepID=A0A1M5Z6J7_9FIRM|nr:BlaI/MecI/CopY family transcriptional regulator [Sporobacter termitidis]SHI19876.1 BlaI family transcriptional regulator, penicillinase repressor [Sporobacter termitidis DSM 10068]